MALCVAGVAGLLAAVAFCVPPPAEEDSVNQILLHDVKAEDAIDARFQPEIAPFTFDGVAIQYHRANLAIQVKTTQHASIKDYKTHIELGHRDVWSAVELNSMIEALTTPNRRFTVELTNNDSILIHCDPVMPKFLASASNFELPQNFNVPNLAN
jgi:hypothetical protein